MGVDHGEGVGSAEPHPPGRKNENCWPVGGKPCGSRCGSVDKRDMSAAETAVKLIEEMIDLKLQQQAQVHLKANPEIARFFEEKRMADRKRLEQLKLELVKTLGG